VVDSDVEMETATSAPIVVASKSQLIEHTSDDKKEITNTTSEDAISIGGTKGNVHQKDLEKVEALKSVDDDVKVIEQPVINRFQARDENIRTVNKVPKDENVDISRDGTSDVIFSQDLVVKSFPPSTPNTSTETGGVNFKRFRKVYSILFDQLVLFFSTKLIYIHPSFYFRGKQCLETASRTLLHLQENHTGKSQEDF
jgi:nibrin